MRMTTDKGPFRAVVRSIDDLAKDFGLLTVHLDRIITESTAGRGKEPTPWRRARCPYNTSLKWPALFKLLDYFKGDLWFVLDDDSDEILLREASDLPSILNYLRNEAKVAGNRPIHQRFIDWRKKRRTPYPIIFFETLHILGYKFRGVVAQDQNQE